MMTVRLLVRGHVQGVGYRDFLARRARNVGAVGWAKNLADGTVEIVVQGSPVQVVAVEAAARTGPILARVAVVDRADILDEIELPNAFIIR